MSIVSKMSALNSAIDDIRESIIDKNIPISQSDGFKIYPDAVRAIGIQDFSEPLMPTIHGVNYYDYNGDLLYVYTPQEFLALSAHPSQPAHTGLIADGWNWTLSDAQTFVRTKCDCLNIGAHYITDDNCTRVYMETPDDAVGQSWWIGFYFRQTIKNGITVDWGDGSEPTVSGTSVNGNTNVGHTYAALPKNFIIKISAVTDCIYTLGNTASYNAMFGYTYTTQRSKQNYIKKVEIGKGVSLNNGNGFRWSQTIQTVSIPKTGNATTLGNVYFGACRNLKGLVLPEGIDTIQQDSISSLEKVKAVCLPKSLTTFPSNTTGVFVACDSIILPPDMTTFSGTAIRYCRHARRIYIPDGISSFANYALADTNSLEELHLPNNENFTTFPEGFLSGTGLRYLEVPSTITTMNASCCYGQCLETVVMRPETPPTAANTNIFISGNVFKIYVPYSADHSILTAYQEAEIWTSYASKMYELDSNGNIPSE